MGRDYLASRSPRKESRSPGLRFSPRQANSKRLPSSLLRSTMVAMEPVSRRLMLMRHAKSSWKSNAPTDHARPLNKRGKRDAPRIAAHLLSLAWVPDLVTSSDSKRTRSTLERMGRAFPEAYYEFTEEFYGAGLDEVRQAALRVPDDVVTWMVLGHNPGWESMCEELTGQAEVLTTANVALLHGSGTTWAEALDAPWRLERVVRPRDIPTG